MLSIVDQQYLLLLFRVKGINLCYRVTCNEEVLLLLLLLLLLLS